MPASGAWPGCFLCYLCYLCVCPVGPDHGLTSRFRFQRCRVVFIHGTMAERTGQPAGYYQPPIRAPEIAKAVYEVCVRAESTLPNSFLPPPEILIIDAYL